MSTIVLTGVTGNLGSSVLQHLLAVIPASRIIASIYNPSGEKAEAIAKTGVTVRRGDYTDPDSLDAAYKGGDKLLIVSSPSFDDDLRIQSHRNAIEAAKRQGIKHIIYTSLAFGDDSTARVMQAHLATESILKTSGVPYTIIREGVYIDAWNLFVGFYARGLRDLYLPGDGAVAWADREDLAEGTAKVLIDDSDQFINRTITFTGPKAYTMKETVEVASSIVGEKTELHIVSEKEYADYHSDKEQVIKFWASTYPWLETGKVGVVDPLLERLLGRPLVTLEERLRKLLLEGKAEGEVSNWAANGMRQ